MRICIFGAGAIGGHLAAKLAAALAPTLEALSAITGQLTARKGLYSQQ